MNKQEIYAFLAAKGLWHEITEHRAVYTMAELSEIAVPYPEADAKNLFVRDDKKQNYYLITVKGNKRADLKAFRKANQTRPLSFAPESELLRILGLTAGSVTPFGILNDAKREVKVFLDEDFFKAPKKQRENIKRSRGVRVRDKHFSKTNNDGLIKFCQGTGLRRKELQELRGKDLMTRAQIEAEISELKKLLPAELTPDAEKRLGMLKDALMFREDYFTHVRNGKGGRERVSPIVGPNIEQIVERIRNTPAEEKVWQHVHQSADIHGYRAEYATAIYKSHARPIVEIPYDRVNKGTGHRYQSQVYTCRRDESGRKLDKAAMLVCSKALGHNRLEVVANNYIRDL